MTDQPLRPFTPPTELLAHLNALGISSGLAIEWVLYGVFALWALYTVVAVYHWLRYSHTSFVAFPAIALHVFVSFWLMAYALSGSMP